MFNPVEFSIRFQQAALQAATAATRLMASNYVRMIEQQNRLLQHSCVHQRDDDHDTPSPPKKQRRRKSPCRGPDLLDHYGHRAHDVDPEHI
ncbi:MAG: hypothetical protein HOK06_06880 [Rhodospirillaceae bacterium]|jgi:hypothetical protein|nr:hypothetical protein [Rhodospirillaceae bacterium]MBT4219387.1 hypothetical protein [Rhodospirillaceae bacterium]MBT4464299.1 hypothetical protein [Rhodospirillaceae bacterium]MBT5014071.1 hypothetical protein [Rhodospirillaceae bacterium]MBT5308700.1 hypothetical protein [Rhodospirillaceae bacterium]